jgi:hypothetical protein
VVACEAVVNLTALPMQPARLVALASMALAVFVSLAAYTHIGQPRHAHVPPMGNTLKTLPSRDSEFRA